MKEDISDLVRAWWEYRRRLLGNRDERKALSLGEPAELWEMRDKIDDILSSGGEDALNFVVALVDSSDSDTSLAAVGAGPMEDLLVEHGPELIERVIRVSELNPRVLLALRSVVLAEAKPDVATRIATLLSHG